MLCRGLFAPPGCLQHGVKGNKGDPLLDLRLQRSIHPCYIFCGVIYFHLFRFSAPLLFVFFQRGYLAWPENDDRRCEKAECRRGEHFATLRQKSRDLPGISSKREFFAIRDSFLRRRRWSLEKSLGKEANPGLQRLLLCTAGSPLPCLPCAAAGLQVI